MRLRFVENFSLQSNGELFESCLDDYLLPPHLELLAFNKNCLFLILEIYYFKLQLLVKEEKFLQRVDVLEGVSLLLGVVPIIDHIAAPGDIVGDVLYQDQHRSSRLEALLYVDIVHTFKFTF